MKKIIIFAAIFLILSPVKIYAMDYREEINTIADTYNVDTENIKNFNIDYIYKTIKDIIQEKISEPIKLLEKALGIVLLCATVSAFNDGTSLESGKITNSIGTLMIYLVFLQPLSGLISAIQQNIFDIKNFISSFLPIFAGIIASSGDITSSTVVTGLFFTGIIFISQACILYIMPSIQFYFSMVIANSLSQYLKLENLCSVYIKIIKAVMCFAVSILCTSLTLQTTISQGTDTLIIKAGKAFTGGAIPVIGSVLQDAVGSVYASMEAIKGFAGTVGIIVIINIFLPTIILLAIYWIITNLLYISSGLFDEKSISVCLKGFIDIIELSVSIIVLFMIMLIFSITIMISFTKGV